MTPERSLPIQDRNARRATFAIARQRAFRPTPRAAIQAILAGALLAAALAPRLSSSTGEHSRPSSALPANPFSKPYLNLPPLAAGPFPPLLSQTGAFRSVRERAPNPTLIPYDLIVPFWSDGADKFRWMSMPKGKVDFSSTSEWKFPPGTVFVKEFDLPVDETNPAVVRRLETRFLVRDADGGVYGITYRWRADGSDADLLATSATEEITIKTPTGSRTQTWYYPSREDCLTCHTPLAGGVLGVKARQLNRGLAYPSGATANQLVAWNQAGLFGARLGDSELLASPKLANAGDASRTIEDRARSYLDANCAQCHRPGGTVAYFDARYETPLPAQGLIQGRVLIDEGIDRAHIVSPHDIWRSILLMRVDTEDTFLMPPLARMTVDAASVRLLREWILSLPGPPVLDPPRFSPAGGTFDAPIKVTLTSTEPGAVIHFTLDGSQPTSEDPVYEAPFEISEPKVVRARAFKQGFTRSIIAQQIYQVRAGGGQGRGR